MGNPLMRVSRNMPLEFSAEWYNLVCQTVEAFLGSRGGKVGSAALETQQTFERVWIQNNSGSNRDKFDVLGIDDGFANYPDDEDADQLSDFREQPVLSGVSPTEDHIGRFVILQEAIAAGEIGLALVAGASLVRVDVSDNEHDFADVYAGEATKLKSASSGLSRIISKPSGTGEKWALVAFGAGGDGECDCPNHVFLIEYKVAATGGTCEIIVNLNGTDLTTISMPWNQIKTGLVSQITALGPFASNPTDYQVTVGGGETTSGTGLPGNSLTVWFQIPDGETVSLRRGTPSLSPSGALLTVAQVSKPV